MNDRRRNSAPTPAKESADGTSKLKCIQRKARCQNRSRPRTATPDGEDRRKRRPATTQATAPTLSRPSAEARPAFATPTRLPRPLEPILVPKLRIHFADFPYLHCSIDQRLLTSGTSCGYGYGAEPDSNMHPRGFQGPTTGLGTLREPQSFADERRCTLSRGEPLPGCLRPYKEKRTLPRPDGSVPQIARVTAHGSEIPSRGFGSCAPEY